MRVVAMLFAAMLLGCIAVEAEPQKDLPGWTNTRWGMTVEQLRKVHPEMTIGEDYMGFTAGRLPDVSVGDTRLNVYLQFKGVGGQAKEGQQPLPQSEWRLGRVELVADKDACYRLAETLTAKYGQPSHNEPKFHLWVLPTTTIRLVVSIVSASEDKCIVIYHPTEKSDSL